MSQTPPFTEKKKEEKKAVQCRAKIFQTPLQTAMISSLGSRIPKNIIAVCVKSHAP